MTDPAATPAPSPPATDTEQLIGRRDAAERAGVHYNTIRLWEGSGLLEPVRVQIGRREEVRYRVGQLDEVAAAQRDKRGAGPPPSTALELPAERWWEIVQEAEQGRAAAVERAARAEVAAQQSAAELDRLERRHAASLDRTDAAHEAELARAGERTRAAEDRAAALQAALLELSKPTGWFLFWRRPVVVIDATGGPPQLSAVDEEADTVVIPQPDADG